MNKLWDFSYILLLIIIPLYYCQTNVSITEPTLISISPINSTALNVTWQFANSIYDQSDLIRISIIFYELYYAYNVTYPSTNYTFVTTNKTITNLIKNFNLVNAFYYVCFSSNSTKTNLTQFVFKTNCKLTRTCLRSNSSICPQASFVIILATAITSNSFTITVYWLNKLPYLRNSTTVQLNGVTGTSLNSPSNDTYTSLSYQFSGLQSNTNYTVNTIVTYIIFGSIITEMNNLTVGTSCSSNLYHTSDIFIFIASSVLLFF